MTEQIAYIEKYCHIRNGQISSNGKTAYEQGSRTFKDFIKAAYKHLGIDYPKFFKMDALSKLALVGAEVLLKGSEEKNVALVLSNRASSLDTDRTHQNSIQDPLKCYPSPAVFVYTLPNICLGEISIRHKLYSENAFFVFEQFSSGHLHAYASGLLNSQKAEKVLCGWVDMDEGNYDAFLYVVAKSGIFTHSLEKINQLYQAT